MAGSLSDTAALVASLELKDKFSKTADQFDRRIIGMNRGVSQMQRGVGQLAGGIGRLATIGIAGFIGGLTASVKVASDFEAQLNTINTIALTTPEALGAIGDGIRQLARDTGTSLDDLTKAYYDLLSAGVSVADAQKILTQANLLAVGTLGTTAQGVDVITTALNAFRLSGDDAAQISEELAVAVEKGKVTLDQIAPSYANVAQTAAIAGLETREIAAAYGDLTAQGVAADEVTTQMNRAILSLLAPTAQLSDLQNDLGVNFAEIAKQKGLVTALEELRKAGEAAGIPLLDLLGRQEAFKFLVATTGPNLERYNETLQDVTDSAGTLADQVGARRQGLAFQFQVLKANIRDAGITIGSALLPELTPAIQDLTTFLADPATQNKIKTFAQDVAGAIHDLIDAAKSGDFQPFIDGLKLLGDIAGKAYDIFTKLPPEVQSLLVTGAALNRLAGGQLLGGATNLGAGLLKIVFERGSSPANPLWVQGTGVGGGGATGAVGGGGGIVAGVGKAFIFTLVATAIGEFLAQNVTRPLDPMAFDYNSIAGASGRFTTQAGAEAFAQQLADQTGKSVEDVKQELVVAVQSYGQTFDAAVLELTRTINPGKGHGGAKGAPAPKTDPDDPLLKQATQSHQEAQQTAIANGYRDWQQQLQMLRVLDRTAAERKSDAVTSLQTQAQSLMKLQQIEGKNFSPTVAVSVVSSVSISDVQRRITSQQIAIGRGFQEYE